MREDRHSQMTFEERQRREAMRATFKVIPGGKQIAAPEPFDFSGLRGDSFLRGHFLEKSSPEFHHTDDFPDAS